MANEQRVRYNFMTGTVDDDPLLFDATTFTSSQLAQVPEITSDQHATIIFDPTGLGAGPELAWIVAHDAAATTADIIRGREAGPVGSEAVEHAQDTLWAIGPVVSDYIQVMTAAEIFALTDGLPYRGQFIYNIETDELVTPNASGALELPWTLAWGFVEEARNTGTLAAGLNATLADCNLAVTFDQRKNRRYRVSVHGEIGGTAGEVFTFSLATGSNGTLQVCDNVEIRSVSGDTVGFLNGDFEFTASTTGSLTIKLRAYRSTGSNLANFKGTASDPAYLSITDIGSDGAADA